jgi:hypothetical protein
MNYSMGLIPVEQFFNKWQENNFPLDHLINSLLPDQNIVKITCIESLLETIYYKVPHPGAPGEI